MRNTLLAANFARLQDESLLHIVGPDTLTFLQGQTTCDTRQVDDGHAVPGAYCTVQGRMVCDFLLLQLAAEHMVLRMRRGILAAATATFGKYIVFSKAELDAQRSDWQVFACWGDEAAATLGQLDMPVPGAQYAVAREEGYALVQLDAKGTQYEVYANVEQHPQHLQALRDAMSEGSEAQWQALQINAGIGRVEGATSGEFLPQMLNYDITGHVNFRKGCYTGQEIVARLHYRGKAKRRLYLASLRGAEPLPAGTDLFTAGTEQASGTVVNSAPQGDGCVCLVSATEAGVAGGLTVAGSTQQLEIGSLPYALPD
jgi:hypothetical protein